MAKYFCSDFHFGHVKIIEIERMECATIQEHDEKILKMLEKLQASDELYFLGDFGFLNSEMTLRFKNIRAKKHMLIGNHDNKALSFYQEKYGFDYVHPGPFYLTRRIVLSHEPIKVEGGILNVHGHLHNASLTLKNYINVSLYLIGYIPLTEKELANRLGEIEPLDKPRFLYEWYAPHYQYVRELPDIVLNDDMTLNVEKTLEFKTGQ